jgi:predicted Fe-Mo cluster-binding NifX family protein
MKIAVAISNPEKIYLLSELFGRSSFFLIYDTDDKSENVFTNPFANELGGAGIQAARFLIEKNVGIVITKLIGKNPFRFLTSANIKVYRCNEETANEAFRLFNEDKLILFDFTGNETRPRRRGKRWNN